MIMEKIIELKILTTSMGTTETSPMMLDISQVSAVLCNHGMYRVYIGSTRFDLTEDSYNKLCSALKDYKEPSESILCNLQHDHTWIKQGLYNLIKMVEEGSLSYRPAILLSCHDKDLEAGWGVLHRRICGMRGRIIDLEKEVKRMTEPKKGQ